MAAFPCWDVGCSFADWTGMVVGWWIVFLGCLLPAGLCAVECCSLNAVSWTDSTRDLDLDDRGTVLIPSGDLGKVVWPL